MKVRLKILFVLIICYGNQIPAFSQSNYNCYFGNIHSHTDYSGGVGVPLQAYTYANNVSDIGFLAVTDHLESIYYSSYEWDSIKTSANFSTINNLFVGMAGYEWTSPGFNHVNVFNTTGMVSPLNVNNWDAFLADLQNQPNAIAQFNHPGLLGTSNWNNFTYKNATIDSIFRLIEVKKFSDDVYYQMALNNGWHVSPTNNQDNHDWTWGTLDDKRTGIWAETLTYNSVIDALLHRRTFSTEDKNAVIWMECNGHPMGSYAFTGSNSSIRIKLNDTDNETWDQVNVVGSNNSTIYTGSFGQSATDTILHLNTLGLTWIFIRAKQTDGDYLWSAPVFLSPSNSSENANLSEQGLRIFPNPASNILYINLTDATFINSSVQIYDISGKLINSLKINSFSSGISLDLRQLVAGYYLLSVNSSGKKYFHNFVVVR